MSGLGRLVGVELLRMRHRRAVWLLVAVTMVLAAVLAVGAILTTAPPSASEKQAALEQMQSDKASGINDEDIQRCTEAPDEYGLTATDDAGIRAECEAAFEPVLENYLYFTPLDLPDQMLNGVGQATVILLLLVLLIVGITFVGHDWATGAMSNQLLFEPRRLRLLAAKAVALALLAVALALVVALPFGFGLDAVASARGADAMDISTAAIGRFVLRCVLGALVGVLLGLVVTTLLRSTVGALGVVLAGGFMVLILPAAVGLNTAWNPLTVADAFVSGRAEYYVDEPCPGVVGDSSCSSTRYVRYPAGVGGALGVLGLTAVGASVSLRRRDVN